VVRGAGLALKAASLEESRDPADAFRVGPPGRDAGQCPWGSGGTLDMSKRGEPVSLRRLAEEKGQALIEFALLIPVLLLIVGGIIQFGKAFSYWSQMNNVAAETARQVVVSHLPGNADPTNNQFRDFAYDRLTGSELRSLVAADDEHIKLCFTPAADPQIGDEVKVVVRTDKFQILPFVNIAPFNLTSKATMRLEKKPNPAKLTTDTTCT
jgi:Flp pilus assembly protein TadG